MIAVVWINLQSVLIFEYIGHQEANIFNLSQNTTISISIKQHMLFYHVCWAKLKSFQFLLMIEIYYKGGADTHISGASYKWAFVYY